MERISSGGSSIRRRSLSISSHISHHTDNDDAECESVSEAGDIGDRVTIRSKRISESSSSFRLSFDNRSENEAVVSIPEEHRLHPNSVMPLPPAARTSTSPGRPFPFPQRIITIFTKQNEFVICFCLSQTMSHPKVWGLVCLSFFLCLIS